MLVCASAWAGRHEIWRIGESDNSTQGFALAPAGYEDFIRADFGFEDRYFLIGISDPGRDFPYVKLLTQFAPGPALAVFAFRATPLNKNIAAGFKSRRDTKQLVSLHSP